MTDLSTPFATKDQARYYLAALIDGEGSIIMGRTPRVSIANTDPSIILAAYRALKLLGIENTITVHTGKQSNWKSCLEVKINRKSEITKVRDQIPVQSHPKLTRLLALDLKYKRAGYRKAHKTLSEMDLYLLMQEVGMT